MPRAPDNAAERTQRRALAEFREAQGLPTRLDGHRTPVENLTRTRLEDAAEATLAGYTPPADGDDTLPDSAWLARSPQLELIPDTVTRAIHRHVPLADVDMANTRPASARMLESVRRLGILQPVVLIQLRGGGHRIVAGRRRVWAASTLGYEGIAAMVYPVGTPVRLAAAISVTENLQRAPNILSDAGAIRALLNDGYSAARIQEALGLTDATMAVRLRYATTNPALFDAAVRGELNMATLYRCSLYHSQTQRQLVDAFVTGGAPQLRELMQNLQRVEGEANEQIDLVHDGPRGALLQNIERITDSHYRIEGQHFLRATRPADGIIEAEGVHYVSGMVEAVNSNRIRWNGLEYTHRDLRRVSPGEGVALRVTVDSTLVESWESVVAFLNAAENAIPPQVDADADRMLVTIQRARDDAEGLVQ